MIQDPISLLLRSQIEERQKATEEARLWADTFSKARAAIQSVGLDEQTIQVSQSAKDALSQVAESGFFRCALLNRYLVHSRRGLLNSAIDMLNEELQRRMMAFEERQVEFVAETSQRTNMVDNALQYKRSVAEAVAKERVVLDDREGVVQQGCACGFVLGCLFLGVYLGFTFLMVMMGKATQADSPVAVIFLSLIVTPLAVSLIMQLFVGVKRWMVEADLTTKLKAAEQLCDKAIEQAENRYRSEEPQLKQRLAEADGLVIQVKDALQTLGVTFKVASEAPPAEPTEQPGEVT